VGRATTNAVVWSSLWIIVVNTLITQVFVNL
jgi:ABC-type transporter Mla maintaining outer membrane lipid asymmetry permease subunit MlaE